MRDLAVGAIAVGERYVAWSKYLVDTLRRLGGYRGPIHVATDRPDAYAGLDGVHPVRVAGGDALAAKRQKMRIFDWVPAQRALYLDVDVVVGRPIAPFLEAIDGFWERRPIALFRERSTPEPFHAGAFAVDRDASRGLLDRWGAAHGEDRPRDQVALATVATECDVHLCDDSFLLFPTRDTYRTGARATFVHLTFTGRQLQVPPSTIARYLRSRFGVELPVSLGDDLRWWRSYLRPRDLLTRAARKLRQLGVPVPRLRG